MRLKKIIVYIFLISSTSLFSSCDLPNVDDGKTPPPEQENPLPNNGDVDQDPGLHDPEKESSDDENPTDFEDGSTKIPRPEGWSKETHGKKATPNYEVVFENSTVPRLDITIAPSNWQAMMDDTAEDYGPFGGSGCGLSPNITPFGEEGDRWDIWAEGNPIYIPCDIEFQGKKWLHVGIRLKGDSSLAMSWQMGSYKLPFRFNFDKFEDQYPEIKNQRFFGFDKLALSSGFMDSSLSREKLTCDIFRAAGVPVGRAAFYRLFVDYGQGRKYFGLYTLQEIPAKPMLKTIFQDDDGNLYKPEGTGAAFEVWKEEAFDKETNEDEADFSDVHELFDILHSDRSDPAIFKTRLERIFDVDGFLRYLAVNQVITNWDSYGRTPHNYFIYHDPGDDLIHWIPFDFNLSLGSTSGTPPLSLELTPNEVGDSWPLIRYIMDIPEYHTRYVHYVKETIDNVFYPERMQAIYTATQNLISPCVVGDEAEEDGYTMLLSPRSFNREFRQLKTHVANRYNAAVQFLQRHQEELPPADDDPPANASANIGP